MSFRLTPPSPRSPRRRARWEEELLRLDSVWRERNHRGERRVNDAIATISRRVEDLLQRLTDLERSTGVADLDRAPRVRRP